jgi:8-oxo-dGTP pyrophosphatase MutT (NUDIX family)
MNLKEQVENFVPYNEQEEKDKQLILKYMDTFDDVLTRSNETAHFTSSSWILNKDRTKVLMIYHKIYDSWCWTGGHADGENNMLDVAIREAIEETGITNIKAINPDIYSLEIICVNGHVKRGKYVSSHVHLNTTFLLEADENEVLRIKEDENDGVMWVDVDKAVSLSSEPWMKKIYQKIIDKTKNHNNI